jgi:peptidoglycan/xylan/chitin deacetylase (PgdA/CDA1 family)
VNTAWLQQRDAVALVYHGLMPARTAAPGTHRRLMDDFEHDLLAISRLTTLHFAELLPVCAGHRLLPETAVAIMFDDALISQYDHAVPMLVTLGLKATFCVPTSKLDARWHFTRDIVRELAGIRAVDGRPLFEIAGHGHAHENYKTWSEADIRADLMTMRDALERLGVSPTSLALPYGDENTVATRRAAVLAGFSAVRVSRGGPIRYGTSPWNLPAYLVHEDSDVRVLLASGWPSSTPRRRVRR